MHNYNNYHHNVPMSTSSFSSQNQPVTKIHGLIVGVSRDGQHHYKMYSRNFNDLIDISSQVQTRIIVGSWIEIYVKSANFRGEFVLNELNSFGYRYIDPNMKYAAARFFPSENSNNPNFGEILIAARFEVKINNSTGSYDYTSYDVLAEHLLDDFELIKQAGFYEGRSFIVEAQATLDGFYVLQVHEDPQRILDCESLKNSVVPFDVMFFEHTCLLPILTRDGRAPTPPPENVVAPSAPSAPAPRAKSPAPQSVSAPYVAPIAPSAPAPRAESSRQPVAPPSQRYQNPTTSAPRAEHQNEHLEHPDVDFDEETTDFTLGTSQIPQKSVIEEIWKSEMSKRIASSKGIGMEPSEILAVVIQIIPDAAILFSPEKSIGGVLMLTGGSRSQEEPPKLGDVGVFEVTMRCRETKDDLLPSVAFTHIVSQKVRETSSTKQKIDEFKREVRCFGGLLELRLKIELTRRGKVQAAIDTNPLKTQDNERNLYILKATNGIFVTIPRIRLIEHLDENLTAKFDLLVWATHRKPICDVALHIGESGEAWEKYQDGRYNELPRVATAFRS